jgi:thioredoxin reductase (NADPH)
MNNVYDMIIIGGGPAGLSAGIYATRAKYKVLIIEKSDIGGQIRLTSEVVNYPGVGKTSGAQLSESMRKQAAFFGTEFVSANVSQVDFKEEIKVIKTDKGDFKTFGVIVATGANPRMIGFKGEKEFKGRGIAYCATCDGEFFTGLDVFVIGAGFAAAEEAMFLTRFARKVTVIAREPEFTCAKSIADKVLAHGKIEVRFNTEVEEVGGDVNLKYANFINNVTGERTNYQVEDVNSTFGVFVFAGYVPASELVRNHVELDRQGYIKTDENLKTNVDGVYGAGDVCIKTVRQVVTAVSDGAIAATNLEPYMEELREKHGIVREDIEDRNVAMEENFEEEATTKLSEDEEGFITSDMRKQLAGVFAKMERNIKVIAVVDDSKISKEVEGFAGEVKTLSDKVLVEVYKKSSNQEFEDKVNLTLYPAILLCNEENEYLGVSFHGVPGGHEFNSFIIALYNAAGPGQGIDKEILDKIHSIDKQINIKIAISLSCTMCPEVVMGAQRIALENKNVTANMLDLAHFNEIKTKYSIMSVPCMIINDSVVSFGRKSIEDILAEINK